MDDEKILMEAFQTTFSGTDGQLVLTHLLNQLGFFATDGSQDPKLVSVANWILMHMGAYSKDTLDDYVARLSGAK